MFRLTLFSCKDRRSVRDSERNSQANDVVKIFRVGGHENSDTLEF